MNVSHLNTQRINDAVNLSEDADTKGFDLQAGQSWIYPTNYPVRDYQYNITQQALHKNTLVSLPTGLGKTFIAAVVMYNFYRWYPHNKIIFMAPTRPLVKQQMDACYNITAIPHEATAELTGTKVQQSRAEIWQNKRVFFITPQVLQNDLAIIIELGGMIKCLVFDEAHRAKGNHAYCEVIRKLSPKNKLFRVLALSATPGNSSRDVLEVMRNLLIAHLEFRSEESPDVKPYVFERVLETVVVPLGDKLQQVKDQYMQILEKYTRTLIKYKVIYGNCGNLTKGKIFMVMKEYQAKNSGNRMPNYAEIMKSLNICVTLYHAYEALIRCGMRAFLNFYEEHINNPLLQGNMALIQIMKDLRDYLGPAPEVQTLPDGTFAEIPASTKFGHPKFYKLRDILISHFTNSDSSTRIIVFFEYRESASEAYALLSQSYPMIRSRVFVGQGSGVTQRDQINTVKAFRDGTCNTLLSTCIGEEGLDVGEVDLIVCFDIANKSPIRMIQRMGRTGRKKEGRIVVLVTEGREQQTLKDCLVYKSNLGSFVTSTQQLDEGKYRDNPKMIPSYIQPRCQKMFITVKKPAVTKNSNLKDLLKNMASENLKFDDFEIVEIKERISDKCEDLWIKENPLECESESPKINFSKHLEKQRAFQSSGTIKQSKQTEILVGLLQFADSKRYNIPVTQKFSAVGDFNQNKYLKQGDIRSMFSKPAPNTLSQETYVLTSQLGNLNKEKDATRSFPAELFQEITNYLTIEMSAKGNCKVCEKLFECPKVIPRGGNAVDLSAWVQPDLAVLDNVTARDLEVFADSLRSDELYQSMLEVDSEVFANVDFSTIEGDAKRVEQKSFTYETPRNFDKILDSFKIRDEVEVADAPVGEKSFAYETPKSFGKVLSSLGNVTLEKELSTPKTTTSGKLGVIREDVEELPVETGEKDEKESREELLSFFKLSLIEDLFVDDSGDDSTDIDKTVIYTPEASPKKSHKNDVSPDLFEDSPDLFPTEKKQTSPVPLEEPGSPILCTYERVQQLKAKKKLFERKKEERETVRKPNLANLKKPRKSFYESSRNKSLTSRENSKETKTESRSSSFLDISDICDLSDFGLDSRIVNEKKEDKDRVKIAKPVDQSDICDLSDFGLDNRIENSRENKEDTVKIAKPVGHSKKEGSDDLDLNDICDLSTFGLSVVDEERGKSNDKLSKNQVKNNPRKELTIDEFCNLSDFFNEKTPKPSESVKNVSCSNKNNEKNLACDISDFCDLSFFLNGSGKDAGQKKEKVVDLADRPEKSVIIPTTDKKLCQPSAVSKIDVVDLTESPSPVKAKPTEAGKKMLSQLSITQMLSLVAKTEAPVERISQKENTFSRSQLKKSQKSSLSLNKKGGLKLKQNVNSPKHTQKKTTQSTPKTKKSKFNISLAGDSDDEFEEISTSPIFAKPKPKLVKANSAKKSRPEKSSSSKQPKKKSKKLFCEYLDEEAVLSEDENVVVSQDEDSGEDCFEASFVADETQDVLNTTHMHAKYLQSVKSPPGQGKFKIPKSFKHNISNVFSQEVTNEDNTYLHDSFCVDSEDVDVSKAHELSELDLLEMKLKEMRKNKKRKRSEDKVNTKRRRIILVEDDSD